MLTLKQANNLIETAFAKGNELGLKPLTVAVLDPGGHLIALQRQDGTSNLRPKMAIAKAAGSLNLGMSSRAIADMASDRPSFVQALAALAPQEMLPAAGGVLIFDQRGALQGAVGVTGDTSDNDETCALYAVEAIGLACR